MIYTTNAIPKWELNENLPFRMCTHHRTTVMLLWQTSNSYQLTLTDTRIHEYIACIHTHTRSRIPWCAIKIESLDLSHERTHSNQTIYTHLCFSLWILCVNSFILSIRYAGFINYLKESTLNVCITHFFYARQAFYSCIRLIRSRSLALLLSFYINIHSFIQSIVAVAQHYSFSALSSFFSLLLLFSNWFLCIYE